MAIRYIPYHVYPYLRQLIVRHDSKMKVNRHSSNFTTTSQPLPITLRKCEQQHKSGKLSYSRITQKLVVTCTHHQYNNTKFERLYKSQCLYLLNRAKHNVRNKMPNQDDNINLSMYPQKVSKIDEGEGSHESGLRTTQVQKE